MREGKNNNINIESIFVKVNEGDLKKNGKISRNVNEGDKIKQNSTY